MAVLERGGNAFDAAVATGFMLQVVEPHLNGPGGEVPVIFYSAEHDTPVVLCGQGVAPAAATIEAYRELGHELVPGTGVLAACVPGAFGAGCSCCASFGTWRLEDVFDYAIGYAEHGFPLVRGIRATIERTEGSRNWPASHECTSGSRGGRLFRNPALAATYRRIVEESAGALARTRSSAPASVLRRLRRRRSIASWPRGRLPRRGRPRELGGDLEPAAASSTGGARLQDGAWGTPGRAPAARAPPRLRPRRAFRAGVVHVVTECAKLAFADVTRCTATPRTSGSTSCFRRLRERAARARGRGGVRGVPAGVRPAPAVHGAEATVGSGEPSRGPCTSTSPTGTGT